MNIYRPKEQQSLFADVLLMSHFFRSNSINGNMTNRNGRFLEINRHFAHFIIGVQIVSIDEIYAHISLDQTSNEKTSSHV